MSIEMLSDQTIMEFIKDTEAFDQCVDQQFALLDVDGDGVLSRDEVRKEFYMCLAIDLDHNGEGREDGDSRVFERFDEDMDGSFDHEEFKSFFKEMMLAMARGIGCMPIFMALERGSMFMCAVQHELNHRKIHHVPSGIKRIDSSTMAANHEDYEARIQVVCKVLEERLEEQKKRIQPIMESLINTMKKQQEQLIEIMECQVSAPNSVFNQDSIEQMKLEKERLQQLHIELQANSNIYQHNSNRHSSPTLNHKNPATY